MKMFHTKISKFTYFGFKNIHNRGTQWWLQPVFLIHLKTYIYLLPKNKRVLQYVPELKIAYVEDNNSVYLRKS